MRILQFVPEELPTYRPDVSALFCKYLPREGVNCDLVGYGATGITKTSANSWTYTPNKTSGGRLQRELKYTFLCAGLLARARRGTKDIIQVRDMVFLGFAALIVSKIRSIPFVYWMSYLMVEDRIDRGHHNLRHGRWLKGAALLTLGCIEKALLYKIIIPNSDHVFCQSDAMGIHIKARTFAKGLTAVPMGVDTEIINTENIQPINIEGWQEHVIGYLGTLYRPRRIEDLIFILEGVRKRVATAKLLLIGDSPDPDDVPRLKALAAERGLADALRITGWLDSSIALGMIRSCALAVSYFPRGPILDTNSPTKLVEYLALGVPCVGNDNPDQKDVIDASKAASLSKSDINSMVEAISECLEHPTKTSERAAQGPSFISTSRSYATIAKLVAEKYRGLL